METQSGVVAQTDGQVWSQWPDKCQIFLNFKLAQYWTGCTCAQSRCRYRFFNKQLRILGGSDRDRGACSGDGAKRFE